MQIELEDILPLLTQPKEYGKYYSARCPFHEDEHSSHVPSMLVYKADGFYICKSCGAQGNLNKLHKALLGYRPVLEPEDTTIQWTIPALPPYSDLDIVSDLAMEAHHTLLDNDRLSWYLEMRGLEDRIIPCKLGYYDGSYTIPIYHPSGKIDGLIVRAGIPVQEIGMVRFGQPKGQPGMLYVPDWRILNKKNTLFVVYGMFDALTLSSLRLAVCSPTSGKDSLKAEWLDFWRGRIVVVPDKGEEDTAVKFVSSLSPARNPDVCYLDYDAIVNDPNDYLQAGYRDRLHYQLLKYD